MKDIVELSTKCYLAGLVISDVRGIFFREGKVTFSWCEMLFFLVDVSILVDPK